MAAQLDIARETERILATIPGGLELIAWFDDGVSFHDAEVVELRLDRQGPSRLVLQVLCGGSEARVAFNLTGWIDISLRGFSKQNVVGDLILREAGQRPVEPWELGVGLAPGQYEIELLPIFGAYGIIRADIASVELAV